MSLPPELTVLVLDFPSLPPRLEEALAKRGFFVESAEPGTLSGTLLVTSPDLILAPHGHLDEACRCVRASKEHGPLSLLIVAPRGALTSLRHHTPKEVTAVVSAEMPSGAIAVRAQTVLKRSSSTTEVEQAEQKAPLPSSPQMNSAGQTSQEVTPGSLRGREAKLKTGSKTLGEGLRVAGQRQIQIRSDSATTPRRVARSIPPVTPGLETSVLKQPLAPPSAATTRVSIEMPATSLPGLRVALLDEDVTRADALSSALREAGHKVVLVSNTSGVTRWSLLRRFGPQVVLVDEQTLARDGGNWLAQFRADPFLRHTALVAHPLATLFNERTGETSLSPLTPQLEGVGRVELSLLAQLSPRREVLVPPNQFNLGRLLALLFEHKQMAALECTCGVQTLSFSIAGDRLGYGTLKVSATPGAPSLELDPDAVVAFLLEHPEATVIVHQKPSLELPRWKSLGDVLQRAYEANLPASVSHRVAMSLAPPASLQSPRPTSTASSAIEEGRRHDSEFPTGIFDVNEATLLQERSRPSTKMPVFRPGAGRADVIVQSELASRTVAEPEPSSQGIVHEPNPVSAGPSQSGPSQSGAEGYPIPPALIAPSSMVLQGSSIRPSSTIPDSSSVRLSSSVPNSSRAPDSVARGPRHTPPGFARIVPEIFNQSGGAKRSTTLMIGAAVAVIGLGTFFLAPSKGAKGENEDVQVAALPNPSSTAVESEQLPEPEPTEPAAPDKRAPHGAGGQNESPNVEPSLVGPSNPMDGDESSLYAVKNATELQSCEELLKEPLSYYESKPRWEGQAIWKRARQQLLIGEKEIAHQLMCQAAYIDRAGPASVGLSAFYLANRSLKNAKEWALYGIEQRKDFPRKSQELLGDALSQLGRADEARDVWLATLKLNLDDNTKLRAVARTLAASAGKARRGGDYPLAERLLRRATAFDPKNADAAGEFAVALLKNREPQLAARWAQRTLGLDQTSDSAHFALGELAYAEGDMASAREHLSRVRTKSSYGNEAQQRLGEI